MEPETEKGLTSLIPKASFAQVVNHPLTWALVIITVIGSGFTYAYVGANRETVKNLEMQIRVCEEENATERKERLQQQQRADDAYRHILNGKGYQPDSTK